MSGSLRDIEKTADKWKKEGRPDMIGDIEKSKKKADKGRRDKCGS
jgi:hypothetical protein